MSYHINADDQVIQQDKTGQNIEIKPRIALHLIALFVVGGTTLCAILVPLAQILQGKGGNGVVVLFLGFLLSFLTYGIADSLLRNHRVFIDQYKRIVTIKERNQIIATIPFEQIRAVLVRTEIRKSSKGAIHTIIHIELDTNQRDPVALCQLTDKYRSREETVSQLIAQTIATQIIYSPEKEEKKKKKKRVKALIKSE